VKGIRSRTMRRLSWAVLGLLAVFAVLAAASRWESLRDSIERVEWHPDPVLLGLSVALLIPALVLNPRPWIAISRDLGATRPSGEMSSAWFASQLGRYMPGKIWLFAGRIGYLKASGLSTARAAAAAVWEVLCSFASVGLVAGPALLLSGSGTLPEAVRAAAIAASAAVFLLPLLGPIQRAAFRLKGVQGFQGVRHATVVRASLLYAVLWVMRGASLWLWLEGLGVGSAGPAQCMAAAPLAWLAGYIVVLVPGGIGIREGVVSVLVSRPGGAVPVLAAALGQTLVMAATELVIAGLALKRSGGFLKGVGDEEPPGP
jgi:glycosyltransferase 2 family protein